MAARKRLPDPNALLAALTGTPRTGPADLLALAEKAREQILPARAGRPAPLPVALPAARTRRRRRRTPVAACGTAAQLAKVVPVLRRQTCLSLRSVFVLGRQRTIPGLRLPKTVRVLPMNAQMTRALDDVRLLIDFTGHRFIRSIYDRRLKGQDSGLPLLLLGDAAFLAQPELLFGRLETNISR